MAWARGFTRWWRWIPPSRTPSSWRSSGRRTRMPWHMPLIPVVDTQKRASPIQLKQFGTSPVVLIM
uniref:Uncharacterized protein n=1 Tax=Arundo donax TaxID=35708 RepID=A0A0A9AVW9_ARUDO